LKTTGDADQLRRNNQNWPQLSPLEFLDCFGFRASNFGLARAAPLPCPTAIEINSMAGLPSPALLLTIPPTKAAWPPVLRADRPIDKKRFADHFFPRKAAPIA